MPAAQILARLYKVARLYVNFFQPSFKLKKKHRQGARVTKHYHPPTTPGQRLLDSESLEESQKQALRELSHTLDPLRLLQEVRAAQTALAACSTPGEGSQDTSDEDLATFRPQLLTGVEALNADASRAQSSLGTDY